MGLETVLFLMCSRFKLSNWFFALRPVMTICFEAASRSKFHLCRRTSQATRPIFIRLNSKLRPTSPTNQNPPITKIVNLCFFTIWMKFSMGANTMDQTQHRIGFKCLQLFVDLPAQPTKTEREEIWYGCIVDQITAAFPLSLSLSHFIQNRLILTKLYHFVTVTVIFYLPDWPIQIFSWPLSPLPHRYGQR